MCRGCRHRPEDDPPLESWNLVPAVFGPRIPRLAMTDMCLLTTPWMARAPKRMSRARSPDAVAIYSGLVFLAFAPRI
jgi:hypothetical protein